VATAIPQPRTRTPWRTFHSLRDVFATWALVQPNVRIEDVLPPHGPLVNPGHQEVYVHVCGDVYRRFFEAAS
jgi:hypothetical protein